jgi:hypothetical protein
MSCDRPAGAAGELALDYARAATEAALSASGYTPRDLDLLISKGVSPTHIAESPEIVGPRLGHALQHALGAKNAFVFDLLDADWTPAFDTAEALCENSGWQLALLGLCVGGRRGRTRRRTDLGAERAIDLRGREDNGGSSKAMVQDDGRR